MKFDILTLFPDMFWGPFAHSIIKRALEKGLLEINTINIRDFTTDKHRIVDDYPYGGGAGMVMKPEPIFRAVDFIAERDGRVPENIILLSPQGRKFSQNIARELALKEHLVFICGHYEGIDERVREGLVTDQISIGDFILTGGELAAMVIVDAVARLIPGVLGEEMSAADETFSQGLLEYPQYTRPREYRGLKVPDILLSGDHGKIARWRRQQALKRTLAWRPDLLEAVTLKEEDYKLMEEEITVDPRQIKD
ncbi:tRNA (guanine37-N1)-methyltransferase [Carboxydocella sporoproducens DSM 16521]|uniref:tRNA (guanine-N(1)-)-methyltransferase n=2 Tax=Carboxydocella TaxID=178898 RepID=A0A1T4PY69_9FIRM|nr:MULTISPECIES: tRNA (guanosine(37)-N1)-methyltransferase TrmD [Carboxydocella]AVX20487.1 tRNA (Guanine37-N(1)-) methyltransferase [Carboxydocella thermautotrophica]AVX30908.1 tRNA (Guanine37-N(1)-) methyltransferase [Carboxydocella thermautotrophica]GAW29696.1 tRNA (guanine(37)-N(1))-methyltransferase [Carboxydocella sp. ULO1]SJZ96267.1 tRNA (guanine37-N1)-methyltransferase [Carboxydocella sporoproducens DSM 16521]